MSSEEEMVDVELNLGSELAKKIHGMTKKELINSLVVNVLRSRVQDETVERLEKENEKLKTKLDKAEAYVEQGRAMVEAAMERWYHYDT